MIQNVSRGRQSLLLTETWKLSGSPSGGGLVKTHTLKINRKRDSYNFQSHAIIDRWNGEEWKRLASIPYDNMSKDCYSERGPRNSPNKSEVSDRNTLLEHAATILDLN